MTLRDIDLDEALMIVRQKAPTPVRERVPLREARSRTLIDDVVSLIDHPPRDNSALDGYACRADDTVGASPHHPTRLKLVGEAAAGDDAVGEIRAGEALSIYTGAPMPRGADAVIALEDTSREGEYVVLHRPARRKDVRLKAETLRSGVSYLQRGRTLSPFDLALAAAMNHAVVPVARRPRIGILATGNELVEPGHRLGAGQICNSNVYGVAALVERLGGEAAVLPHVRDDLGSLERSLEAGRELDLVITTGGVSVGRYDLVRDLLLERGDVYFWRVRVRPGKPVLFGAWRDVPVLALPGNPGACLIMGYVMAATWLTAALGSTLPTPYERRTQMIAATPIRSIPDKTAFWWARRCFDARSGAVHVRLQERQDLSAIGAPQPADCLVVMPPGIGAQPGDVVEVIDI